VILNLIEQLIPQRSFVHVMTLRHADMAIVEGIIPQHSQVAGQTLAEIPFPSGVVIAAIHRGAELILPTGSSVLYPGDEVIAVTMRDQEAELRELLVSE
jgi:trk system potassium uptake protein